MTDNHPRRRIPRLVIWLVLLAMLGGAAFVWGEDLIGFVTGQDIMDDLRADLADFPTPSPWPTPETPAVEGTPPPLVIEATSEGSSGETGAALQLRQHVFRYTVQEGDSLFRVAERFSIHPDTIFWANTETLRDNVHLLHVGTRLYILPVDGVYHESDGTQTVAEIAASYRVEPQDILQSEFNQLSGYDSAFIPPAGLRIVVPNGRREYISWRAPIRTGSLTGAASPQGSIHPGSCQGSYIGSGGLGDYVDPMGSRSYFVTNEYAQWHAGLDLAAPEGTSIYAAETGVVVFAGWHLNGYGELIILDHGGGWTTYYAHLSDRLVGCGDQVSKGQLIGAMGQTGNATGVHLHFEVRYNDTPQDPRLYLDFSGTPLPNG